MRVVAINLYRTAVNSAPVRRLARRGKRFAPVRRVHRRLMACARASEAEVDGHRMFLGDDSLGLSIYGIHEPFATHLVKQLVRRGDVAVDLGANVGYYTLQLARLVGPEGSVYAFEPHPANVALLEKNVKANGYENVVAEAKAVADRTATARLFVSARDMATHRIFAGGGRRFVEVEAMSLDDYFRTRATRVDFVKMDIQGAEVLALEGMVNLLQANERVAILTEFSPYALAQMGGSAEAFLGRLAALGFTLYVLDEGRQRLEPAVARALLERHPLATKTHADLLCVKGYAAGQLARLGADGHG